MSAFDPSLVQQRLARLWALPAEFGRERSALRVYLDEWVSDRYALINGLQVLRDELQFADPRAEQSDLHACGADFALPTVITTLGHTNCGDRIHQGEATHSYETTVATRFATMSEIGELKLESFHPTGGGTDDGDTLAHVTVAHAVDANIEAKLAGGHPHSFLFAGIDLQTHVGRLDEGERSDFGRTRESPWREARAACGAIAGTLGKYDPENAVHRRLRADLGEENFAFLSTQRVRTAEGDDVTLAVAAAIVSIQGMRNTAEAMCRELPARGIAHVTASTTVNRVSRDDTVLYLARATSFAGEVAFQGLGTDARKYGAALVEHGGERRLQLSYGGVTDGGFTIERWRPAPPPTHRPIAADV